MKGLTLDGTLSIYTIEVEGRDYAQFDIAGKDLTWALQKQIERLGMLPNGFDKPGTIGHVWLYMEIDEETE